MESSVVRVACVMWLSTALWAGIAGCGDDSLPEQAGKVSALNLESGEVKRFDRERDVPAGWAVCADERCLTFPPGFPCQILGPGACLLNAKCRLKLRCEFDLSSYGWSTARSAGEATDGAANAESGSSDPVNVPDLAPAGCEFACTAGDQRSCGELPDKTTCAGRADCVWEETTLDAGQGSGSSGEPAWDVPCGAESCLQPPMFGYCREKVALTCEALDRASCERRADCSWQVGACPLACAESGCDVACEPFCQPREVDPGCPPIAAPRCNPDELLTPELDAEGCATGYRCAPVCPEVYAATPECPGGRVEPVLDERGCTLNYVCVHDCADKTFVPPPCEKGTVVPVRDANGCVIELRCELAATETCDALGTRYQEALAQAKRCSSANGTKGGAPLQACSLTVANSLGCPACPTFVNPAQSAAITELTLLQDQWAKGRCGLDRACPAVECMQPAGASCQSASGDPNAATCVDAPGR